MSGKRQRVLQMRSDPKFLVGWTSNGLGFDPAKNCRRRSNRSASISFPSGSGLPWLLLLWRIFDHDATCFDSCPLYWLHGANRQYGRFSRHYCWTQFCQPKRLCLCHEHRQVLADFPRKHLNSVSNVNAPQTCFDWGGKIQIFAREIYKMNIF